MPDKRCETILVVDDNPATLYATARVIRQAGYCVVECETGLDAVNAVTRGCDLVVLDIDLPDIDGHEVCRRMRLIPGVSRIPVVHLSATFVSDYHKIKGLEAGADGYLTHPVEPLVLLATIKAFLRTREIEDALTLSEAKFRSVFDQSLMGICLITDDTIYLDVNPAMCNMLGRNREEMIGKHCSAFARTGHEADFFSISDEVNQNQKWLGSIPMRHRDGHSVELEWTVSLHSTPGVLLGLIADVTEKRKIEMEKEFLLQSERAARSAAEHANRLKDEFLATLSHELRTPLNAIVGWSQVLQMRTPSPGDLVEGLEAISRNARAQAELINDLLDVSRIMSGKLRLDVQTTDPVALIRDALASVSPAAQAKGVLLEHRLTGEVHDIKADPHRLQQVIWNLVNNAVKFTPAHGKVTIVVDQRPSSLIIQVSDTGQGITPEFLPFLFERFRQEDAATTRAFGGLGLGLAIVKQLVELHGGTVKASSAGEGLGAEFVVTLPLVAMGQPVASNSPRPRTTGLPPTLSTMPQLNLQNVRVLIVDDDYDSRHLMKRVLQEARAEVLEAESVEHALTAVLKFDPHLILSDIGMPHLDGYDLIRRVRALNYPANQTPAIAVTAFTRTEDRQSILENGFDFHLSKPLSASELFSAVGKLLSGV